MKRTLLGAIFLSPLLAPAALADTSIGIGAGPLHNGLGVNIGIVGDTSLRYLSAGCVGWSNWSSESTSGNDGTERDQGYDTNCGIGRGSMFRDGETEAGLRLNLGYQF